MKRLIYLLILTCSTSCSISGSYYLRNLTEIPAIVTIVLNENETSDNWENFTFPYEDKVRSIRHGMFKRFKKQIKVRVVDQARIEFTIPPKSTVFIGPGINTRFWGVFKQAKVKLGDNEKSFTTNDSKQMNLERKGLLKYVGHYDIEI